VVRPGALTKEQIGPGGEFELEGSAAPAPKAEAPWVAGARKYNDAHAELVSEFNELTKYKCALDDGLIDPQAVAHWQRQHGLEPDGKVGPHTLAAARHAVAKAGPAGGSADARIPV
jgi:murein L,D-transpeptidase YcbB/YkuD